MKDRRNAGGPPDDRAAAVQMGAVVLFGFLVVTMAGYQAVVVPAQNASVEFDHSRQVGDDLIEARNAVLETKQTGRDGYVTVQMGTRYPVRTIAVNPAPSVGTLRTTDLLPVTVLDGGGSDVSSEACPGEPSTRLLTYDASYTAYDGAPTYVVENTVAYRDYGDAAVAMTDQRLVQGETVQLVPLKGAIERTQSDALAFEPRAGKLKTTTLTDPTVVVPTRLSETDWEALLEGEVAPDDVDVDEGAGELTLTLSGEYDVACGPVAVDGPPPGGTRGDQVNEINPAAPGDVRYVGGTLGASNNVVVMRFNNTAETTNFTHARINYYQDENTGGKEPHQAIISDGSGTASGTLVFRADTTKLSPKLTLAGNGSVTEIELAFLDETGNAANIQDKDWLVLTLVLESGEQGLYFVPIPK